MSTWYPGVMSYRQWQQAESFKEDIETVVREQTNEIVASQEYTRSVVSSRLSNIAKVNQKGFDDVSNAIESLHSDFNYYSGLMLQELEIQSGILRQILYTLQNPLKTQVEEFYRDGCRLVQEEILDKAVQKFSKAITLDDTSFLCYYQLGLLYLNGRTNDENVIDLTKANDLLLTACRYGKGKAKTDANFKPAVANALFFTSLSYYYQMHQAHDGEFLHNAIRCAEEALQYNPYLTQASYHLAKYYSIQGNSNGMLPYLKNAIKIDSEYALHVNSEKAFDTNRQAVNKLLTGMRDEEKQRALPLMNQLNGLLNSIGNHEIEGTVYEDRKDEIKKVVQFANQVHRLNTYFGYLDIIPKLQKAINDAETLKNEIEDYLKKAKDMDSSVVKKSLWEGVWMGCYSGGFVGIVIGFIGCTGKTMGGNKDEGLAFWGHSILWCAGIASAIIFMIQLSNYSSDYNNFLNSKRKK